jgi:tetratricopeptide (TPR) repeat protein
MGLVAFGQQHDLPKKPNVEKAKTWLDQGDLAGAKAMIDFALQDEKLEGKAKTQYYKGLIYQEIFQKQDSGKIETIDADAFDKAVDGYKKVKKMENEYGTYYNFADLRLQQMYSIVFNWAARQYQNDQYDSALINFDRSSAIMDNDTTAITYAGYAAQQDKKPDVAMKHFKYLADHNMADVNIYRNIIYIERNIYKDTTAALNTVEQARKLYPDDHDLKQDEITMMILTHKVDKAKQQLLAAIEKDPDNYMYYYEMGYIYDNEGDLENSIKYYEKCLDKNPDYFEANYNIGVKEYNEGAKLAKQANFMSVEEYKKNGKAIMDSASVYFKKALPYFEKCHELQPDDASTIQTLAGIYGQLKMKDKSDEMNALMEKMGIGNSSPDDDQK